MYLCYLYFILYSSKNASFNLFILQTIQMAFPSFQRKILVVWIRIIYLLLREMSTISFNSFIFLTAWTSIVVAGRMILTQRFTLIVLLISPYMTNTLESPRTLDKERPVRKLKGKGDPYVTRHDVCQFYFFSLTFVMFFKAPPQMARN